MKSRTFWNVPETVFLRFANSLRARRGVAIEQPLADFSLQDQIK